MSDLPSGLWVETRCALLSSKGIFYTVIRRGNYGSGVIMLKLLERGGACDLYMQQRNLDGELGWMRALPETADEAQIDSYIDRNIKIDPDLWALEIELDTLEFPFDDEKVLLP